MKHLILAAALCVASAAGTSFTRLPALAQDQTHGARAIDGDTIVTGGQRVRLAAIDAPELHQSCQLPSGPWACGEVARVSLQTLIDASWAYRQTITCQNEGNDRYGRVVATCHAGGMDLGAAMVGLGLAVPYMQYGGARYLGEYRQAVAEREGMHAGTFENPAAWRHAHERR